MCKKEKKNFSLQRPKKVKFLIRIDRVNIAQRAKVKKENIGRRRLIQ